MGSKCILHLILSRGTVLLVAPPCVSSSFVYLAPNLFLFCSYGLDSPEIPRLISCFYVRAVSVSVQWEWRRLLGCSVLAFSKRIPRGMACSVSDSSLAPLNFSHTRKICMHYIQFIVTHLPT